MAKSFMWQQVYINKFQLTICFSAGVQLIPSFLLKTHGRTRHFRHFRRQGQFRLRAHASPAWFLIISRLEQKGEY